MVICSKCKYSKTNKYQSRIPDDYCALCSKRLGLCVMKGGGNRESARRVMGFIGF